MPNMNAMVGEGAAAVCGNTACLTKEDVAVIIDLFNAVGKAWPLEEKYFSIHSNRRQLSCVYIPIYRLHRSCSRENGLPKDSALEMATQAILGSAQTLANSDENPWTLIDRVSSPGGTTVAGIVELEDSTLSQR